MQSNSDVLESGSGLDAAAIAERVQQYQQMEAAEGPLPAADAAQLDQAFGQLSADDKMWAVRANFSATL